MQNAKCKIADETVTIYKETGNGASRSFFYSLRLFCQGKKSTSLGEGALSASLFEGGGFYAVKLGGSKVGAHIGRPFLKVGFYGLPMAAPTHT